VSGVQRLGRLPADPGGGAPSLPGAPPIWPLVALGVAILVARYLAQVGQPTSWHFFADAASGLFGRHGPGLDLYAVHPEYQFGPLSAMVAWLFQPIPHLLSRPAIVTFGSVLGVVCLVLLEQVIIELHPGVDLVRLRRGLWCAAIPVLYAWSDIAVRNEHIDDALALTGIVASALLIARRRPWAATICMAVAVAAKPWAIVCVPMLAAPPGRHAYSRLTRPLVAAAAAGATWLPFVLDAPQTLTALSHFQIVNSASSSLRVLGVTVARTPSWDRPAQMLFGLAAATLLVRLDRWWAVPMAALGIRLLLDPGTHRYYTAGLALAVLLWELVVAARRVPWRSIVTVLVLEATATQLPFHAAAGRIRLALLLLVVVFPLWEGWRSRGRSPVAGGPPPPPPAPRATACTSESAPAARQ
jgi:hypothetical protein